MSEPTTTAGKALAKVSSWPGGERIREAQITAIEAEAAAAARAALLDELEAAILHREKEYLWPIEVSDADTWDEEAMSAAAAVVAAVLAEISRRRP